MGPHTIPRAPPASRASDIRDALDALRRIVRALRLSATTAKRGVGVSAAQLFVLQLLAEKPGSSVNDLAELTNTDQSSVSVVVRRLTVAKLIARKVAPDDGRRVELRLTPRGRRLIAKRPEPKQRLLFAALDRLKPTELQALARGLGAVVREMRIDGSPPAMFFEDDRAPSGRPARAKKTRIAR